MGRLQRGVILAGRREELSRAICAVSSTRPAFPLAQSGWIFRLDPDALGEPGPSARSRVAEALRALSCQSVDGLITLEEQTLYASWDGRYVRPVPAAGTVDPSWVDWIPAEGITAAVCIALDPRPEACDTLFAIADRIEKADPAWAKTAPVRTRLNVLALGAQVRPEVDLWPRLRGVSACIRTAPTGRLDGALVILHTTGAAAAERIVAEVLPRLAARFRAKDDNAGGERSLAPARVAGRPVRWERRDATVLIGWGDEILPAGFAAGENPARSAGKVIRACWNGKPPQRTGAFWPGRIGALIDPNSVLAAALAESPPVLWTGTNAGGLSHDEVRWAELRGLVRRFLDRIPQEARAH
jgi:hypothetical protein